MSPNGILTESPSAAIARNRCAGLININRAAIEVPVIASEAKQSMEPRDGWIASSQALLAMTVTDLVPRTLRSAVSAFTRVFDALWRNPGFRSAMTMLPDFASLNPGYDFGVV